jgi:anaphase-promoting complex subunit 8
MWCAMGQCYLGLKRRSDAIRSYERAVSNHDTEGTATRKLATLYSEDGNVEQAARCYLRHLELMYQAQVSQAPSEIDGRIPVQVIISSVNVDEAEAEALLFLAHYHRDHDEFEVASMCCSRLLDYPGQEKEDAKALLREIRSRIDKQGETRGKRRNVRGHTGNADASFEFSP